MTEIYLSFTFVHSLATFSEQLLHLCTSSNVLLSLILLLLVLNVFDELIYQLLAHVAESKFETLHKGRVLDQVQVEFADTPEQRFETDIAVTC